MPKPKRSRAITTSTNTKRPFKRYKQEEDDDLSTATDSVDETKEDTTVLFELNFSLIMSTQATNARKDSSFTFTIDGIELYTGVPISENKEEHFKPITEFVDLLREKSYIEKRLEKRSPKLSGLKKDKELEKNVIASSSNSDSTLVTTNKKKKDALSAVLPGIDAQSQKRRVSNENMVGSSPEENEDRAASSDEVN